MREDHQPSMEPPRRPQRTPEEMQAACGRAITFVLALDPQAEIDVAHAIAEARAARVPAVFILACPQCTEAALDAVRTSGRKGKTLVQAVEFDVSAAVPQTRDAGDFELFELSYGLIAAMKAIADSALDTYDSILVMDAAQVKVTADHLYEACLDLQEHPGTDVVASWIQWLRRPPYVISRDFLEALDDSPLTTTAMAAGGVRPVPHVRTRDHVFGEEQLAAPKLPPAAVSRFLDGATMTALQAVTLAHYAQEHAHEELVSPNAPKTLMGPAKAEPLGAVDRALVDIASLVLGDARSLSQDEAAELAWADEFGKRNKRDFPLLNDRAHAGKLAYLDSAATSQRINQALQAQRDFDEHENANVYRGAYELSAQATFTLNDARKRLEDFIGAERRQTVYCANTTAATNLVAQAWGERNIGEGDLIVCGLADHHSNMLPFLMLAQRKGARVEYIPFGEDGRMSQDAYGELLAKGPKLVCLTHIDNVLGIEEPVGQMAAAAHEVGARVLVDAAQSFPHVKVNVADLGADWVAISAHKAYGPMGIGALWISPAAFEEMDPLGGGGGSVSHVGEQSYYLRPLALQYELGTPPVSQAVGWAAAIDYLEGIGMENVARHGAALTRYAVRGLQSIDGVNVLGDHTQPDGLTGLVSFTVRSVTPAELAAFLGRLGVAVRSGGHCSLPLHAALGMIGTGRISIGVHTTKDDIDAALVAVELCRRMYEVR